MINIYINFTVIMKINVVLEKIVFLIIITKKKKNLTYNNIYRNKCNYTK